MSVIKDYLQMVRDGIKNRDKIIEALAVSSMVKNGEAPDDALAEILKRKDICAGCKYNSRNAKPTGYVSGLPFEHCILCKCRIGYDDSKEYCLSCTCGADDFNRRNPNNPLEVKWIAIRESKEENKNQQ